MESPLVNITKKAYILEAYAKYGEGFDELVNANGYFTDRKGLGAKIPLSELDTIYYTTKEHTDKHTPHITFQYRLKTLKGIDNNNGWIILDWDDVKSISDIPKGWYRVQMVHPHSNEVSYGVINNVKHSGFIPCMKMCKPIEDLMPLYNKI